MQMFALLTERPAPREDQRFQEAERRQKANKPAPKLSATRRFLDNDGKVAAGAAWPSLVVREYAHQHPTSAGGVRSDFTDTVYWHPVLVLPDGTANVSFQLSDAITRFQATAYAHSLDGRIGAASAVIEARLPFSIEPKMPIEVTANDKIDLPVTIANDTNTPRAVRMRLQKSGLELVEGKEEETLQLAANERTRRIYRLQPAIKSGQAMLQIDGLSAPFSADSVQRSLKVVPDGFPIVGQWSDALKEQARQEIPLPEQWFPGTLQCQVQLFPSLLSDIQTGLDGLLHEPFG